MSKHPERYDSKFGSIPCANASYVNNLELVSRFRRMLDLSGLAVRQKKHSPLAIEFLPAQFKDLAQPTTREQQKAKVITPLGHLRRGGGDQSQRYG